MEGCDVLQGLGWLLAKVLFWCAVMGIALGYGVWWLVWGVTCGSEG